jgi:hypothetical protein
MIGWLMIGASVLAMYRITSAEGKNGVLWGLITFLITFACGVLIPAPLINIGIGFVIAFLAYFVFKLVKNE